MKRAHALAYADGREAAADALPACRWCAPAGGRRRPAATRRRRARGLPPGRRAARLPQLWLDGGLRAPWAADRSAPCARRSGASSPSAARCPRCAVAERARVGAAAYLFPRCACVVHHGGAARPPPPPRRAAVVVPFLGWSDQPRFACGRSTAGRGRAVPREAHAAASPPRSPPRLRRGGRARGGRGAARRPASAPVDDRPPRVRREAQGARDDGARRAHRAPLRRRQAPRRAVLPLPRAVGAAAADVPGARHVAEDAGQEACRIPAVQGRLAAEAQAARPGAPRPAARVESDRVVVLPRPPHRAGRLARLRLRRALPAEARRRDALARARVAARRGQAARLLHGGRAARGGVGPRAPPPEARRVL